MIVIGGDKIVPVLSFNDKEIGQKKGPITEMLQKWYQGHHEEGATGIKVDKSLLV